MKNLLASLSGPGGRERRKLLLIAVPFVVFIIAFSYVPLLWWAISFVEYYPGIPFDRLEFVGLQNFRFFFYDLSAISRVLRNTFALSGLMILSLPLPAIFAIMLNELRSGRLKKTVQTFSTIPYFISYVLLYLAVVTLFSPSDGMLNQMLVRRYGLLERPISIMTDGDAAWFVQTAVYLFKNMGYNAILYVSAIASIDLALYDAASVDGAGRLQKIIHVTVPGLVPTFIVLLVLGLGNILSGAGFEQYYVFSNPRVLDKLEVIDTYTYKLGILQGNYSFGTAISMLKSLLSIILLFIANKAVKKVRGTALF
jgi:ABC-type polysaccharide transport system permease subunit